MTTYDPQPHSRRAAREAERAAREASGIEPDLPEDFDDSEVRPRPTGRRALAEEEHTAGAPAAAPAEPEAYDSSPFRSVPTAPSPVDTPASSDVTAESDASAAESVRFRPRDFSPEGRRAVVPPAPGDGLPYRTLGATPFAHPADEQTPGDMESTVMRPVRPAIPLPPVPVSEPEAHAEDVIDVAPSEPESPFVDTVPAEARDAAQVEDAGGREPSGAFAMPAAAPAAEPAIATDARETSSAGGEEQRPLTRRELRRLQEAAAAEEAARLGIVPEEFDDRPQDAAAPDEMPHAEVPHAEVPASEDSATEDSAPAEVAEDSTPAEVAEDSTPADVAVEEPAVEQPAADSVPDPSAEAQSAPASEPWIAEAPAAPEPELPSFDDLLQSPEPLVEPEPITSSRDALSNAVSGADVLQNLQSPFAFPFVPEQQAPDTEPESEASLAEPVPEHDPPAAQSAVPPWITSAPPVETLADPSGYVPLEDLPAPPMPEAEASVSEATPAVDDEIVEAEIVDDESAEPALDFPPPFVQQSFVPPRAEAAAPVAEPTPEPQHPATDPFGVIPSAPFIDATEGPSPFVEPPVQRASYTPPPGHWSRQADLDDAEQPYENTLSRDVGGGNVTTTTSALILPAIPQSDFANAMANTGEILVTGSINLPHGFATTGTASGAIDAPDVDQMFDAFDGEVVSNDSQPVRAIRAVSTHTATQGVIVAPRRARGSRLMVAGVIVTGVLALGVIGLLIIAFTRIF